MRLIYSFLFLSIASVASGAGKLKTTQIGIRKKVENCKIRASKGDAVTMHYKGYLVDGKVFDNSRERSEPFTWVLGEKNVIEGLDKGIYGMCVGEERKLKIPSHEAFGSKGVPPMVPSDATLIYEVECVGIDKNPKKSDDSAPHVEL